MNDLVVVEVLHARGDLLGPIDQPHGRDLVGALPQEVEEWTVRAKLHDDAVARRLGANAAELKYNFGLLGFYLYNLLNLLKLGGYCRVLS